MRRTGFVGALAAVAIGTVLAIGVAASPRWLDLREVGLFLVLVGAAVLVIRILIARGRRPAPTEVPVALDQWQRVDVGTAQAHDRAGYERAVRAAAEEAVVRPK